MCSDMKAAMITLDAHMIPANILSPFFPERMEIKGKWNLKGIGHKNCTPTGFIASNIVCIRQPAAIGGLMKYMPITITAECVNPLCCFLKSFGIIGTL